MSLVDSDSTKTSNTFHSKIMLIAELKQKTLGLFLRFDIECRTEQRLKINRSLSQV